MWEDQERRGVQDRAQVEQTLLGTRIIGLLRGVCDALS